MHKTTSNAVVAKLMNIFARWGVPKEVVSDGGPQCASQVFKKFAHDWDFQHIITSPHYPQAKGAAEAGVKIAKASLKQDDPSLALLTYRSTKITATGYSPAEVMLQRKVCTTLLGKPGVFDHIRLDTEKIELNNKAMKASYAMQFNRRHGVRESRKLHSGDTANLYR